MIAPDARVAQQQIYNFLQSCTIKYEPLAHYVNETLTRRKIAVNYNDPTSWKYYINLTGHYHVSDQLMHVVSLDTRQTILLSPETLVNHPRTKSAYAPGGVYHNRLCETYPEQVDLIKSIVFPVSDIQKAITSDDFTLLQYGTGYLEPAEEPILITELETFLKIYAERWYFDFLDDEPYFYITAWGSLWTYLAMCLMSARVANIKTAYVHSFHIWNALKAEGIDDYSDILDRKKSMMLYQNIDYLRANAGKQSNLIILANGLLDSLGVALYGRKVVQESDTGADNYQLTPQLVPVRLPTDYAVLSVEVPTETVAGIQVDIVEKGLSTKASAEDVEAIERRLGDTTLNNFKTKFLEIRPIARNKPYAELLNTFLLETLMVSVTKGYYAQAIEIADPLTNATLFLSPPELMALYHYATLKSLGITPEFIPNSLHLNYAFDTEIRTPAKTLPWQGEKVYLSMDVNSAKYLANLNYSSFIGSPADFSAMVSRLWLRFLDHLVLDQSTLLDRTRFIYGYLASLCHTKHIVPIELVSGFTRYDDWLGINGLDLNASLFVQYGIQANEETVWGNLADSIISGLIPITDTLNTFGNFTLSDKGYDRLRQLFVQMCSYRVVFLSSERDVTEAGAPYKYSTKYGKCETTQFGENIVATSVDTQDTTRIIADRIFLQGVFVGNEVNVKQDVAYTVTEMSALGKTLVTQSMPIPPVINAQDTVIHTHGMIQFTRNPVIHYR